MTDKISSSNVPVWAWALGCLVLTLLCAGLVIAGALIIFFATVVSDPPDPANTAAIVVDATSTNEPGQPTATEDPRTQPAPTVEEPTPEPVDEPTSDPTETNMTEDPYSADRSRIEASVAGIRNLIPKETVNPTMLNTAELRQRLKDDLAEEYSTEEAQKDAITLSAFDMLSPDFNIYDFTLDLLTEQVAGFYDPETDEFVIISEGDEFGTLEQLTHAHEYVHALQDQHFALDLLEDEGMDSDASFAIRALAEGDATLVQTLFLTSGQFDQQELFDLLSQLGETDFAVLESAPPVLARELEFPYTDGLNFVQTLYEQGGFSSIDGAWQNLPQSTEQILHPDRYVSGDVPQIVHLAPLTDTLGVGWQLLDEDTFGEFYLREYLSQQLDAAEADIATTGWGGDRYAVYWNDDDQALVMMLRLVWDTALDGDEFASAYANYPGRLFGAEEVIQVDGGRCWQGSDVICLYHTEAETLIVRAPDVATAEAVARAPRPL